MRNLFLKVCLKNKICYFTYYRAGVSEKLLWGVQDPSLKATSLFTPPSTLSYKTQFWIFLTPFSGHFSQPPTLCLETFPTVFPLIFPMLISFYITHKTVLVEKFTQNC